MRDLSEFVNNPELVVSTLGEWPSLHDAEVLSLELKRDGRPSVTMVVKAIPYDPAGRTKQSLIALLFKGVLDVELVDFNEQNVVWNLLVEKDGAGNQLIISPSYGLAGRFHFEEATVLSVEPLA